MLKNEELHEVAKYIQYVYNITEDWLKAELEGRRFARFTYHNHVEEGELKAAFRLAKELPEDIGV